MTKKRSKADVAVEEIAATSDDRASELVKASRVIEEAAADKPKYQGIAVCGSHPDTVAQAPFDDSAWLIYACSPHNIEHRELPRVDEWFEVHIPIQDKTRSYHYLRTLEHKGYEPIWMRPGPVPPPMEQARNDQERAAIAHMHRDYELNRMNMAWFKGAREYPEAEMKSEFSEWHFTSSIAFIFAKAIKDCERLKIPQIGLFGIMQRGKEEYEKQLTGLQYFFHEAKKRGIKIGVPREAQHLFMPPPENW